jgi:hypothetical protein
MDKEPVLAANAHPFEVRVQESPFAFSANQW